MMLLSSTHKKILLLVLLGLVAVAVVTISIVALTSDATTTPANRVVTFKYAEDSATCGDSEYFDFDLLDFHVDCGNANHGCTPGHSIMIWGEFNASTYFNPIADVKIKACEFWGSMCTNVLVETVDWNLCTGLNLEDEYGYQNCEREGFYTFERSFTLPNHTWWEDMAVHGFSFQIYVTLDDSLTCHGQFVTNVWYSTEAWVSMAVGSMVIAAAVGYYYRQKMPRGIIDLCAAENMVDDTERTLSNVEIMERSRRSDKNTTKQQESDTNERLSDMGDDESVTSTSYLRMLDFSPEGLNHADRMEQVRQAHFERLRLTRESRRGRLGEGDWEASNKR